MLEFLFKAIALVLGLLFITSASIGLWRFSRNFITNLLSGRKAEVSNAVALAMLAFAGCAGAGWMQVRETPLVIAGRYGAPVLSGVAFLLFVYIRFSYLDAASKDVDSVPFAKRNEDAITNAAE